MLLHMCMYFFFMSLPIGLMTWLPILCIVALQSFINSLQNGFTFRQQLNWIQRDYTLPTLLPTWAMAARIFKYWDDETRLFQFHLVRSGQWPENEASLGLHKTNLHSNLLPCRLERQNGAVRSLGSQIHSCDLEIYFFKLSCLHAKFDYRSISAFLYTCVHKSERNWSRHLICPEIDTFSFLLSYFLQKLCSLWKPH